MQVNTWHYVATSNTPINIPLQTAGMGQRKNLVDVGADLD